MNRLQNESIERLTLLISILYDSDSTRRSKFGNLCANLKRFAADDEWPQMLRKIGLTPRKAARYMKLAAS
jgi:hypothetical protein